jgi:integrase
MLAGAMDLFAQDGGVITIRRALGVDADIPLGPAVVLFGPNDSGKTNTLLAIANLCRERDPEQVIRDNFRHARWGESACHVSIPLDLERADHRDLLVRAAVSRHTFASLMIAAGVNAKALSTYMGHSSITITLDRYGHLMPGNETQAAELLDGYLARAIAR